MMFNDISSTKSMFLQYIANSPLANTNYSSNLSLTEAIDSVLVYNSIAYVFSINSLFIRVCFLDSGCLLDSIFLFSSVCFFYSDISLGASCLFDDGCFFISGCLFNSSCFFSR
ncbi:hypothetical protein BDF14DRAFT_1861312 [Spinellus fusiger]|nr:hypothetical protein BDF14DRAFT_1861312 [Spinellus fusiger]